MNHTDDIRILRDLAKEYAELAAQDVQEQRRQLWSDHNSRLKTRPPVLATYGMWNVWCREVFGDQVMQCRDSFFREQERWLRMELFRATIGDDYIQEPWITLPAVQKLGWGNLWGLEPKWVSSNVEGGAHRLGSVMADWADMAKLVAPMHHIDEEATALNLRRLTDALGDLLPVNCDRGPICQGFMADISTMLARLRGLEQFMIDMYDSPRQLHQMLAFMRDGILANQAAAEAAGDYGLTSQQNQCMTYCRELPAPRPNVRNIPRKQLWAYCAAQEFTLISPAMHDEFMLQYQKPIMETAGLSSYGCCEDLTRKIDILRQVRNLRIIAVTPRADVRRCAEQIGTDYVMSWRPNPADMVCCGFNETLIRRIIGEGLAACRGGFVHLHLKDIETVEGEPDRLARWVRIVRELSENI
jgi:hypothetical protein